MFKTKIGIVSLVVLVACFSLPAKALALSLKCPINEYGIEECPQNPYEKESDQFEGYPYNPTTVEMVTTETSDSMSDYEPLIVIVLVILGLLIGTLYYRRLKVTSSAKKKIKAI